MANFVAGRPVVALPPLDLSDLYGFAALTPSAASPDVNGLASACVDTFERYRAPLSQANLDRRREANLTARQDELLVRWGYPYVMEEFHFHGAHPCLDQAADMLGLTIVRTAADDDGRAGPEALIETSGPQTVAVSCRCRAIHAAHATR